MSRTFRLCIAFLAGAFVASQSFAQLDASTTCHLTAVPKDALRVAQPSTPTMFHFPDPRIVPLDYSGCLNTWIEGGFRLIEAKFEGGKIKWYRMGTGTNDVYCEYENDRVTKEVVSNAIRKQRDQLARQLRDQMPFCPPGEHLVPSKWR